ncbi:MAG: hypothetical protein WBA13_00800 [Microcoleaceae cyanobacterium]
MQLLKKTQQFSLSILGACGYGICAVILVSIAATLKVIALILAHNFLYPIFVFGDLLRGLELINLLNLLVFAVVGMGLGLATALLPINNGRKISSGFLIILIPVILAIPQFVKYDLWLNDIVVDDNIPKPQAQQVADSFLKRRINHNGVFGFYIYTGQFPMVPTRISQMQDLEKLEKQVNSKFVKFSGIPPALINIIMGICFWGIRLFYFGIAAITAISHFKEGLKIVGR